MKKILIATLIATTLSASAFAKDTRSMPMPQQGRQKAPIVQMHKSAPTSKKVVVVNQYQSGHNQHGRPYQQPHRHHSNNNYYYRDNCHGAASAAIVGLGVLGVVGLVAALAH